MLRPGGAPITIAAGIRLFARATPHAVAVVDGARSCTFAELDARSSAVANALLTVTTPGARIGVLAGNRMEYFELVCGIAKAGMVMVR
jgi:long-chain acyl-CoA synthetase